jgi:hypothetical protein
MPALVTFLYPAIEGETFNEDYYLNKHMAMVEEKLSPIGLQHWCVTPRLISTQLPPSLLCSAAFADSIAFARSVARLDPASGNVIQCMLTWDSADSFQKFTSGELFPHV